jgi:hypothetical protein
LPAVLDSPKVARDSLSLHDSTPRLFILMDRRQTLGATGDPYFLPDADDIDARGSIKLHCTHLVLDAPHVHLGTYKAVGTSNAPHPVADATNAGPPAFHRRT